MRRGRRDKERTKRGVARRERKRTAESDQAHDSKFVRSIKVSPRRANDVVKARYLMLLRSEMGGPQTAHPLRNGLGRGRSGHARGRHPALLGGSRCGGCGGRGWVGGLRIRMGGIGGKSRGVGDAPGAVIDRHGRMWYDVCVCVRACVCVCV